MKVGIPKEIKNNENRAGMTPSGVAELVRRGHTVYVQRTARHSPRHCLAVGKEDWMDTRR